MCIGIGPETADRQDRPDRAPPSAEIQLAPARIKRQRQAKIARYIPGGPRARQIRGDHLPHFQPLRAHPAGGAACAVGAASVWPSNRPGRSARHGAAGAAPLRS
jgi:hypothetical protein